MDYELIGKIITGVLASVTSLAVCIMTNRHDAKKIEQSRQQQFETQLQNLQNVYTEQITDIRKDYSNQIIGIKDDYSAQVEDLKDETVNRLNDIDRIVRDNFKDLTNTIERNAQSQSHSIEIIQLQLDELHAKQDKYNNLQERTTKLEGDQKLMELRIHTVEKKEGGI